MSWVKKRATTPAPPPQVPMYNPNQENQWQQQPHDNWYNQPQKQNWGYQQPYDQYQEYYQNNTPYQQPQPTQPPQQTYGNLQYNQQYTAQNNVYAPPPQQSESDGWSTNWGWGDEDNSNIQAPSTATVAESFSNEEAWNWNLDESNKPEEPMKAPPQIDRLTGKRNKLETPQWSVESQLSQESSDDVLQTSESDKSRMLSRSSTISHSPISAQDPTPQLDNVVKEEPHFENKQVLSQTQESDGAAAPPPPMATFSDDKGNPYKRNAGLSHKAANKFRNGSGTPPESRSVFQPTFHVQSVNLETLPDNSEQPDPIPPSQPSRKISPSTPHSWAENNEAPINDRNQYLETAQLSDVDLNNYNQVIPETLTQDNDTLPPPGLRRMVPGQTVAAPDPPGPPEGLHRMIPGESSSPESTLRSQTTSHQVDDSEPEFNEINAQRSATIGADTPPVSTVTVVNRSETIGADTSPDPVATGGKKGRRDSVEGQIQDADIAGLVSSVKSLVVGDDGNSGNSGSGRRHSKQESTESEGDVRTKSTERRERRYREKEEPRERNRSRYSPDDYRDRKYDRRRYKDRRYEEDTDYYSDKEKDRRHRDDREYDRKYSSLKKDKDKERKRRDDRDRRADYGREPPRKSDYYYGRFEEDYENESRSRASSRSDSMHESYRDRDRGHERDRRDRRHRDKERHRRHTRDPFNPYSQGFGYDIYSQYYQQYQYYENLRKTNPQAYAQLYRKYYQDASGETPYGGEDRASVHSGRSSANDELAKDSFVKTLDQTDTPLNYEDPHLTAQRLTPAKFATAHLKVSISSGKLVKILPHYPLDGQAPTVELCSLETLLYNDDEYQELKRFPGPLVKGTTHKKTIIEYCESKIRSAYNVDISDRDSYVLMWELLILLIRQNGMVVGADIAELLLKNHQEVTQRPPSVLSSIGSNLAETPSEAAEVNTPSTTLKEEEITNKFREYLLYGSGKEALEWAMKHGLWGHALFLASKLDKRTYANVMMRFANGLTMNDPLQTLYQLLSGRTPAAVTCVSDEKWGDWRPHLAMILSNSTQRPELNCKAITILGDTLMGRGSLYAAQFCYLMAEVGFGQYGSSDAKLVLLGSNHNNSFIHFATNEAIHMTEVYEYARSLNDDEFSLVNFQRYKYLQSTRLADVGLLEKSLSYLEKIANFIVKNPGLVDRSLVNEVSLLADRLKYYDPVGDGEVEVDFDSSRVENSWLKDLRRVQNDYNMGLVTQNVDLSAPPLVPDEQVYNQTQDVWQPQQYEQTQQQQQQQWNPEQNLEPQQSAYHKHYDQQQQEGFGVPNYHDQQEQQQQRHHWSGLQWNTEQSGASYQESVEQQQSYYGGVAQSEPDQVEKQTPEVSTCLTNVSSVKVNTSATTLRKRLTTNKCEKLIQLKSLDSVNDFKTKTNSSFSKNAKIYPFKNRSAEDFVSRERHSSRDSSDIEFESGGKKKNVFYKNEEKSQLICYKDNTKIIAIKNDSKLTKYNTFDMKFNDRKGKIVKYKSLDVPETLVKYYDSQSNVAITAQDFVGSDFKITKFDKKRHKHDIITDTVDAWAKKSSSSNVFSNLKNSIFKSNKQTKEVIYKPLVFGGTYPIDVPLQKIERPNDTHKIKEVRSENPKFREYGPPKTFDIDRPI